MLGGLYATTHASRSSEPWPGAMADEIRALPMPTLEPSASEPTEAFTAPMPTGRDVPLEEYDEARDPEVVVDAASGVAIGPLVLRRPERAADHAVQRTFEAPEAPRARRSAPRRTPGPRLDPDPGRHVILTAREMMSRGETVRGSCYAYLSEVFDRAGHEGWRTRSVVFQGSPNGPYADLDVLRPGDWLYIVNNPDTTPVGTHSVLFVGWEDRASGYARTISHAGWAAGASPGRESSYDVTRTYRVIRPRMAD